MDLYLDPPGFLGTGASLLADLTLLAYVLLIVPAMLVGYVYARRGRHRPQHKTIMIAVTLVNWLLIAFVMIVAYRFDVVGNFPAYPTNPRYLLPTIHGALGLAAQLLATYVVYRMLREDVLVGRALRRGEKNQARFWFRQAKPTMRVVLVLWLATSLIGVFNYLFRYDIIPPSSARAPVVAPASTPEGTPEIDGPLSTEAADPVGTAEVADPLSTEAAAPVGTAEVDSPAATPEAPVATEEAADDSTSVEENYGDDDYGFSDAAPSVTEDAGNDRGVGVGGD